MEIQELKSTKIVEREVVLQYLATLGVVLVGTLSNKIGKEIDDGRNNIKHVHLINECDFVSTSPSQIRTELLKKSISDIIFD